tara:strand:- start:180 stop:386 length:207 start_codon:yes stop_codon:yes gene_type:complete
MWLIVFFMSLPFGVKVVENPVEGNANSAPIKTNIKLKFILSFLISFLPSICIYLIVEYGLLENFIKNI